MGGLGSGRPMGSKDTVSRYPRVFYSCGQAVQMYPGLPAAQGLSRISLAGKVKTYPAGRKCQICGVPLSIYNPNDICTCHTNLHLTW